ncbi:MAG: hypothetical protein ACR2PA_07895, partial [Hyphomicrobiaceae bacterium]
MGNALRAQTATDSDKFGLLDDLLLSRAAAKGGATRSDVMRDVGALTAHKLSPSELRGHIDSALEVSTASGLLRASRNRFVLTDRGQQWVAQQLGCKDVPADWAEIRDVRLVASALGLAGESERRLRTLLRPDGLRAAILQQSYSLPGKRLPSPARLRNALAVVALERAFGNKIKSGFNSGKALSARASRLLAGQLAQRPRDFGTDARLIAALAAEACGSVQSDAASLRTAILRAAFALRVAPNLSVVAEPEPQRRRRSNTRASTTKSSRSAAPLASKGEEKENRKERKKSVKSGTKKNKSHNDLWG